MGIGTLMLEKYTLHLSADEVHILEDICLYYHEAVGSSMTWDTRVLTETILGFAENLDREKA